MLLCFTFWKFPFQNSVSLFQRKSSGPCPRPGRWSWRTAAAGCSRPAGCSPRAAASSSSPSSFTCRRGLENSLDCAKTSPRARQPARQISGNYSGLPKISANVRNRCRIRRMYAIMPCLVTCAYVPGESGRKKGWFPSSLLSVCSLKAARARAFVEKSVRL